MIKIKHLIAASQLSAADIMQFLTEAEKMEKGIAEKKVLTDLSGKIVACVFFEPSTRTRLSFETAALRLGGKVISMENASANSSSTKGESLTDTIKIINGYADAIVMRHPRDGAASEAAAVSVVPFINAGDGGHEHPTQALLDLYTIKKRMGRLNNLRVAFGFDPLHSRTIKSLAQTLSLFENNEFIFISPKGLELPQNLAGEFIKAGAKVKQSEKLEEGLEADIFYANRLQEERFADENEFEANRKKFILTKEILEGKKVLVMDPLPKIDEIGEGVDDLPNAIYFEQARNGLFVRMAIYKLLMSTV